MVFDVLYFEPISLRLKKMRRCRNAVHSYPLYLREKLPLQKKVADLIVDVLEGIIDIIAG